MFQLLSILSFLLRLQYKVFHSKNLHSHSVCSWLHPCIFLNFFETLKCQFHKNSKKKGSREPGCLLVCRWEMWWIARVMPGSRPWGLEIFSARKHHKFIVDSLSIAPSRTLLTFLSSSSLTECRAHKFFQKSNDVIN
jgi:hypothetical protein